ncbi:hypothetical protein MRX96_014227 [Rhipicephalus microplus]
MHEEVKHLRGESERAYVLQCPVCKQYGYVDKSGQKKKRTKLHPPADSLIELESAPDENQAPSQKIFADQTTLQEHSPTSHSELMRAVAALESQLATANNQALKLQTELAVQVVRLSKARAALAIFQPELETAKKTIKAQSKKMYSEICDGDCSAVIARVHVIPARMRAMNGRSPPRVCGHNNGAATGNPRKDTGNLCDGAAHVIT